MFRRRMELKTDYRKRLELLKSRKPRLVIRRGPNGIRCQIIEYNKEGDKTMVEVTSQHLRKFGWKAHLGNLPAAYLTGMLAGFSALKKGVKEAVADVGLQRSTKGSALYACVSGAADAGLKVPLGEEAIPTKDRIAGKHVAAFASLLKKTPEKYKRQFSSYLKLGVEPERLEEHFAETQKKIRGEFKDTAKLAAFEETAEKFLSNER